LVAHVAADVTDHAGYAINDRAVTGSFGAMEYPVWFAGKEFGILEVLLVRE